VSAANQGPHRWRTLCQVTLPAEPGNDRLAVETVSAALRSLPLSPERLDRLKTAIAEATLNALEHGSGYQPERPIVIHVRANDQALKVGITNTGERDLPNGNAAPDLEAKLAGEQSPRGWGFFLIEHMVDEVQISNQPGSHTIELFLYLEGA
jgi:anti-sigma regulatory factor (Ser/Thr protein kinase)